MATLRIGAPSAQMTPQTIAERRVAQAQIAATHRMRGPSHWLPSRRFRRWALAQLTAPRWWHPDEDEARELRTHARRLPNLGITGQQVTRTLAQRLGDVCDGAASGEAWRRTVGETLHAAGLCVEVRHAVTVDDLESPHEVWQYTITPVQSSDTVPTPKTLAQSPLAQASGLPVRYHASASADGVMDAVVGDVMGDVMNQGEPVADDAADDRDDDRQPDDRDDDIAARDTVPMPVAPLAAPAATCATGAQTGGGYPHVPGSVRIGDLIEPATLQHVTDVLYGRMQPVTQPLPHRGQRAPEQLAVQTSERADNATTSLTSEVSEVSEASEASKAAS